MAVAGGPNIVEDGLVLALDAANPRCYTSGSTTVGDRISNSTGSLNNGVDFEYTSAGSFDFDQTDDTLTVSPANFSFGSQISFEVWVKPMREENGYGCMFVQNATDGIGRYGLGIRGTDGYLIHYIGYSSVTVNGWWAAGPLPGTAGPSETWHHIVASVDMSISGSTNRWIYHNGSLLRSTTANFTTTQVQYNTTTNLQIVQSNYKGKLSIANIYNKVLSPSEVAQNYAAMKGRFGL